MDLYIFVGMYNGINGKVEPYISKADAVNAWAEYTGQDYTVFGKDKYLLEHTKYDGSTIYEADFPMECYDPNRQIAIIWDIDDVKMVRPDLNDEQALEVLERVKSKHDAEMGVSWATLECWADMLYPSPSKRCGKEKLVEMAANLFKASTNSEHYTVHYALLEASETLGISDLHNDEDDPRYSEYEELVYEVEKQLGIAG
jgi:hypothetical protein